MTTHNTYDEGDCVRLSATFTNLDTGDPLDPETVKLSVRDPDGDVITYEYSVDAEITRADVGEYAAELSPLLPGFHYYRWHSSGAGQAAEERRFFVTAAHASP